MVEGGIYTKEVVVYAFRESFKKLDPRSLVANPVMFVVEVGFAFTFVLATQCTLHQQP